MTLPLATAKDELIIKVPDALYDNWREITYNMIQGGIPAKDAQPQVFKYVRNYIITHHPQYKLCAFEEVESNHPSGVEAGFYMKLRMMSKEDYALAIRMNKEEKYGKDGNPQWILELSYIPELKIPITSRYPAEGSLKKHIQVWSEGYAATGESGTATLLWEGQAENFDNAVQKFNASRKNEELKAEYYPDRERSHWYFWGCALFDNEADARKSFG